MHTPQAKVSSRSLPLHTRCGDRQAEVPRDQAPLAMCSWEVVSEVCFCCHAMKHLATRHEEVSLARPAWSGTFAAWSRSQRPRTEILQWSEVDCLEEWAGHAASSAMWKGGSCMIDWRDIRRMRTVRHAHASFVGGEPTRLN